MSNKPVIFSPVGFLRLTRAWNLLIVVLTQLFTAYFLLIKPHEKLEFSFSIILLSLGTVFIAAAGYVINDYYDVKIDYINKPGRVVVGKYMKRRAVMITHVALNVIGLGIGLYLSLKIFVVFLLTAGLLWLYSNQLKRLPFVGNFSVALLTGLTVYIVALYIGDNNTQVLLFSYFAMGMTLIREIIKDIQDKEGDRSFGCKTLPVIWDIRSVKRLLYAIIVGFVLSVAFFTNPDISKMWYIFLTVFIVSQLGLGLMLYFADQKKHYGRLSMYCKLLMVAGILCMVFFN
ncbi:MAG: geranylgeranylglycerol-phosphate geranylgeranyltransferase [Cyclobacteriaceae bacterium]|nr:geranylgeranylglycerol-phosphate geranylgeranyltransferase [Cyclobacteriaceae bacterium]